MKTGDVGRGNVGVARPGKHRGRTTGPAGRDSAPLPGRGGGEGVEWRRAQEAGQGGQATLELGGLEWARHRDFPVQGRTQRGFPTPLTSTPASPGEVRVGPWSQRSPVSKHPPTTAQPSPQPASPLQPVLSLVPEHCSVWAQTCLCPS